MKKTFVALLAALMLAAIPMTVFAEETKPTDLPTPPPVEDEGDEGTQNQTPQPPENGGESGIMPCDYIDGFEGDQV